MKKILSFIFFGRAAFRAGFFIHFITRLFASFLAPVLSRWQKAGHPLIAFAGALALSALAFPSFAGRLVVLDKTKYQSREERQLWLKAVKRGDLKAIEDMYEKNPNLISAASLAGQNAFEMSFAEEGRREVIDWFLKKGFSADTALMLALSSKTSLDIIEWLLSEKGASANAVDANGQAALLKAVVFEKPGAVKILLKYGARAETANPSGWTPLMSAIKRENLSLIRLLLLNKANPNSIDETGSTPLMMALWLNSADIAEELLRAGANPNFADSNGRTALMKTALYIKFDMMKKLLDHGADINERDPHQQTPLMKAISKERKIEDIKRLLEHGADPNIEDKSGISPLVKAVLYRRPDIVERLLNNGANIKGQAVLLKAVWIGDFETIQKLLEHGADLEETGARGIRPLMSAAQRGKPEIARALLAYGADPLAEDKESRKAIDYIELEETNESLRLVRQILKEAMEKSRRAKKQPSCRGSFEGS